jgi:hypothetical protein
MSNSSTIEDRLARVEEEVVFLKSQFNGLRSKDHWIDQILGSFKDDPEFDEVLKLGRQIRQADRPDAE